VGSRTPALSGGGGPVFRAAGNYGRDMWQPSEDKRGAASAAHDSLGRLFGEGLFSPEAILTQLIDVAVLIAIVFIDWPTVIDKARGWWATRRGRPTPPPIRNSVLPGMTPAEHKP
jgi:hypothetical protein